MQSSTLCFLIFPPDPSFFSLLIRLDLWASPELSVVFSLPLRLSLTVFFLDFRLPVSIFATVHPLFVRFSFPFCSLADEYGLQLLKMTTSPGFLLDPWKKQWKELGESPFSLSFFSFALLYLCPCASRLLLRLALLPLFCCSLASFHLANVKNPTLFLTSSCSYFYCLFLLCLLFYWFVLFVSLFLGFDSLPRSSRDEFIQSFRTKISEIRQAVLAAPPPPPPAASSPPLAVPASGSSSSSSVESSSVESKLQTQTFKVRLCSFL